MLSVGITTAGQYSASLERKVDALFEVRGLFDLAEYLIPDRQNRDAILSGLSRLQGRIYVLDRYGETTWKTDARTLDHLWCDIRNAAFACVDDAPADVLEPCLQDIRRYQDVEIGMRDGFVPVSDDLFSFYRLKTCDVRLMRSLLLWHSCVPLSLHLRNCLDLADVLAEMADDMADVEEDAGDFNCNRFLLSRGILGDNETRAVYSGQISSVSEKVRSQEKWLHAQEAILARRLLLGEAKTMASIWELLDFSLRKPTGKCRLLRQLDSDRHVGSFCGADLQVPKGYVELAGDSYGLGILKAAAIA